jgi:hypothetical protein
LLCRFTIEIAGVAIQRSSCLETQAAIERDSFVIAADDLDRDADCSLLTRQVIRLTCSKSEESFAPMPWPGGARDRVGLNSAHSHAPEPSEYNHLGPPLSVAAMMTPLVCMRDRIHMVG